MSCKAVIMKRNTKFIKAEWVRLLAPRSLTLLMYSSGNYTRFINHSCAPNSQFEKFCWLGTERIILVSRGIEAGAEITVDYSHEYWDGLDKECLCGEPCCRYLKKQARPT